MNHNEQNNQEIMNLWQSFHVDLCSEFQNPIWFTGTLRQYRIHEGFNSTISLTRQDVEKTAKLFINWLNRLCYGSQSSRRHRIKSPHLRQLKASHCQKRHLKKTRINPSLPYENHFIQEFKATKRLGYSPVIEGSTSAERRMGQGTKHMHLHALIDCPLNVDLEEFKRITNGIWVSLEWASGCVTEIREVYDLDGVANYAGKSASKTGDVKEDNFLIPIGHYEASLDATKNPTVFSCIKTGFYRKASLRRLREA